MTTDDLENQPLLAPSPDEGIAKRLQEPECAHDCFTLRSHAADTITGLWADLQTQKDNRNRDLTTLKHVIHEKKALEKHLAEAVATITALSQENEHLKQFGKYIQHLRTCPHFMAMRFQLEPGWIAVSHSKPCTCGLAEAIAKQSECL